METVTPPNATPVPRTFAEPVLAELRDALVRVLHGSYDDVWTRACASATVDPGAETLGTADLDRLLAALDAEGGVCRVVVLSFSIRHRTAQKLARLER
jgi:hypothetical protein